MLCNLGVTLPSVGSLCTQHTAFLLVDCGVCCWNIIKTLINNNNKNKNKSNYDKCITFAKKSALNCQHKLCKDKNKETIELHLKQRRYNFHANI